MSTVHIPVASIQHRFFPKRDGAPARQLITYAVDGVAEVRWHAVEEGEDRECIGRENVIETFLQLWHAHQETGLIIYVVDSVVRRLLKEEAALFPGLHVREVVTGQRLGETARRCAERFHTECATEEWKAVPPLVIATDASRGFSGKLTGLGAANSSGEIASTTIQTPSIAAGEFAAVDLALQTWWCQAPTIHILTDSQVVWRRLNGSDLVGRTSRSNEEKLCIRRVDAVRARGVDLRVHWVRGHNGHVLNDCADRLAMAARRSVQFQLGAEGDKVPQRLRAELAKALKPGLELVPAARSRDYRPAMYAG